MVGENMLRDQIIEVAKSYLGTPYKKLDCSAFVRAVFRKFGYELPRVSASQAKHLYGKGVAILIDKSMSVNEIEKILSKGNVVAWSKKGAKGRWKDIHHISIYDEDGYNYESSSSKGKVVRRKLWENSTWQIVLIADMTSLLKKDEEVINENSSTEIKADYQQKLAAAGYQGDMNPAYYGSWGDKTEAATKLLQKAYGLTQTGEADAATLLALADAYSKKSTETLQSKIDAAIADLSD